MAKVSISWTIKRKSVMAIREIAKSRNIPISNVADEIIEKALVPQVNYKHYYINRQNQIERLISEYKKHKNLIVGFDYDNTVFDYHNQGHDYSEIITLLQDCQALGFILVVHTCSEQNRYDEIIEFLENNSIKADYINQTPDGLLFAQGERCKPYCNIYLDDRGGLLEAYIILSEVVRRIKEAKKWELI